MQHNSDRNKELRNLVTLSFEEKKEISKKIANRPKTPRRVNKSKRTVSIAKQPIVIPDNNDKKIKNGGKKKTPSKGLYICHVCEKTYKTKRGILKHIKKCSS